MEILGTSTYVIQMLRNGGTKWRPRRQALNG
jgi:hypothetical protein